MKKSTKLLVFILSVILLICSAICVSAAEESIAPEIMAKNVVYGADIRFQFAVDAAELGEGKTVLVKVYDADPAGEANLLDTAIAAYSDVAHTNLGVDYAYIATTKVAISAIAFGQEFWAVAECDGVAGTPVKYSAIQYFLQRLYKDADVITPEQKAHYENAIAYGSTAQIVTGDTKPNVADYLYVMAADGKVNGASGAVVLKGDALDFTYTGSEDASGVAYWLDPNGNKTSVATVSGVYTAKFADYTFGDLSNNTVITASNLTSWQKVTGWVDGDKDTSKYNNFLLNNNITNHGTYSYSIVDGKLKYTSSGYTSMAFGKTDMNDGNHTVYETDMTITVPEGTSRTITMSYRSKNATSGNAVYEGYLIYDSVGGNVSTYFKRNNTYTGVSAKETGKVTTNVAAAGATTATFRFKVESFYIAETDDSTLVLSINDKPVWILDSRGVDRTNAPTSDAQVLQYQNTDDVWVSRYAFTEEGGATSGNYTPKNYVFTFVTFQPNKNHDCEFLFDNITLTYDDATAPVYNLTRKP